MSTRTKKYTVVSNTLACMSNQQLIDALLSGKEIHTGIGGTSVRIEIENIPVFVKQVPITELELDIFMSTANIFDLPMCYQYGIGSAGFNVWRELAAHVMTTNWVITGQCLHFPIMYNWRIIPDRLSKTDVSYWGTIANYLDYWENNPNIKERVDSLNNANASLLLFLEHFPKNLYQHLKDILLNYPESDSINYLEQLHNSFEMVFKFMHDNNFLHMDAHFHNILADEESIYLSDFGLALSNKFDLSTVELNFINDHKNYDRGSYFVNLLHSVLTSYIDNKNWDDTLSNYLANKFPSNLPDKISDLLSKHASIAEKMHRFYKEIQKDKSTPYPFNQINHLLKK
ncbi:hypothetical protein [Legionella cardiaca]|uniref:Protein kinase domain-containing protein n=1 Tax=Legionella cardiaca TaxID=1071983 RepID=A0ABY8ARD8_9GAMM|nr:hypothetical protein [Legionella cardiaca]WED43249.1 hypothetical protein PXX05_00290 [Legionella cardiaca]